MSFVTNTDFISPKNSERVTLINTYIVPNVTDFSVQVQGCAAVVTLTGSAYTIGKLVTIRYNPFNFIGDDNIPQFSIRNLGIPPPTKDMFGRLIITFDGTPMMCFTWLDTGSRGIFLPIESGIFASGKSGTVHSCVFQYLSA